MKLSVVSTLYCSSKTVLPFLQELKASISQLEIIDFEVILVDDGSPDDSLALARKEIIDFPQLKVIGLSKNFGHHQAIREGLKQATGDYVFLIDSDLEESPSLLASFFDELEKKDLDVIVGVQEARKGRWFERITGAIFWWLFSRLTELNMPANVSTVRLMKNKVVKSILAHEETEFFFHGIAELTGFKSAYFKFKKGTKGSTAYSVKKRISLMLTAITSFSSKPLYYMISIGFSISTIALLAAVYVLVRKYAFEYDFQLGWPSLVLSIWFFSGLIISLLGVIGVYTAKTYMEVKNRPSAIISNTYTKDQP